MDEANKSQGQISNQTLTRSQRSSSCPTARSPGLITANSLTDSGNIPTALTNSTHTAIGATNTDFEGLPGMSDTSAGSSKPNSKGTSTAISPSSPQIILNDLRRGSLFGRQSNSESANQPNSITNVTFSNSTFISTASQGSEIESSSLSESEQSKKSMKKAKKLAKNTKDKSSSVSTANTRSRVMSIMEKNKQQMSKNRELKDREVASKISLSKSKKSKKANDNSSKKSAKSSKLTQPISDVSAKSGKSSKIQKSSKKLKLKSQLKKVPENNVEFEKKVLNQKLSPKIESVSINPPLHRESNRLSPTGNPYNQASKISAAPGKINTLQPTHNKRPSVAYNFPGVGRCTKNMDTVAPPSPMGVNINDGNVNHCVYDIAKLQSSQRRVPPSMTPMTPQMRSQPRQPKSLFGARHTQDASNVAPAAPTPIENKVVVYGITPDGKNKVEFTIQMRLVSGEALGLSSEPVDFIPKKVIVGGKEIAVETPKQKKILKTEVEKLQ